MSQMPEIAVAEFDPYAMPESAIQEPPATLGAALRKIGPGIILAGTIVGSGELMLTTSLGARHGFAFLWLIIFSCVIKVFVQVELGRYAISSGKPTLGALNELGGPRLGAHWMVWAWLLMMLATIFQHAAMVSLVAQSMNFAFPGVSPWIASQLGAMSDGLGKTIAGHPEYPWAGLTCLTAITLLWSGGYRRIEKITTALVVGVTVITLTAALALPATPFPIPWAAVDDGLRVQIPPDGVAVAFSVFGVTGVGATELFYYPYWCLEKGYARFTGRAQNTPDWERRAKGWIRVMHLDVWVSMVVFTVCTLAFYFMGATVLHPQKLDPKGPDMIVTLSRMFVDTFGEWTRIVFLFGAAAVLFKTHYISSAGNSRLTADFLSLAGFVRYERPEQRARWVHYFTILYPIIALLLFLMFSEAPQWMVFVGGVSQAVTLPLIAAAALYFRYRRTDRRITPGLVLDGLLWLAVTSITLVAVYAVWDMIAKQLAAAPK